MEPSISQRRLCTFPTLSSAKAPAKCYDPNPPPSLPLPQHSPIMSGSSSRGQSDYS